MDHRILWKKKIVLEKLSACNMTCNKRSLSGIGLDFIHVALKYDAYIPYILS